MSLIVYALAAVGALSLFATVIYPLLMVVWLYIPFRPRKSFKSFGAGTGAYAIVTGATDGIGKAYAIELAKKGFNLVLMSRTLQRLEETQKEIQAVASSQTIKIAPIDFTASADEVYDKCKAAIAGLDIGVLINNVGMSSDFPVEFHDQDLKEVKSLIQINVYSAILLTHLVIPSMLEKKRGWVVNISSASALQATPLLAVYGATKTLLNNFTIALAREYQGKGICFEVQAPYFVESKLSKMRKSFMVPSAKAYVASALNAAGCATLISPYPAHNFFLYGASLIPSNMRINMTYDIMHKVRKRALAKKAREETAKKGQ